MKLYNFLIILLILSNNLACTVSQKPLFNTPPLGGNYTLIEQNVGGKMLAPKLKYSKIQILDSIHQIECNLGCNSIGGNFETEKEIILPIKWVRTEMSCGDELDKLENTFVNHLSNINHYRWEDHLLKLYNKEVLLLVLKKESN